MTEERKLYIPGERDRIRNLSLRADSRGAAILFCALGAFLSLSLFLIFPGFSENSTDSGSGNKTGVLNVPPKIIEIFSTASSAGKETLFTITAFDGNSGYDICTRGALCNASCSFAELFSSENQGRAILECDESSCKVFGQFVATDSTPAWDPKTSQLVAKVPFSRNAKVGRWSCEIAISDDSGESDTKSYSIYLRPETDSSRFFYSYQRIFFSIIVPLIAILAIAHQLFRIASRRLSFVDWEWEIRSYIEAKAHIAFIERELERELERRKAERIYGLLSGAKAVFSRGDYSGTIWLSRSIEGELGHDSARIHIPKRLLSLPEKLKVFSNALFRRN